MEMKRVAIYARVSTKDQKTENQLIDLRSYCEQRGWQIAEEFIDQGISGAKDTRPALTRLMDKVRKARFDAVLVWKFDRFARSTRHLINTLEELKRLNIDFISYSENIDTSSPAGKLTFTLFGAIAEFERELIRERVLCGLQRAKMHGIELGRPKLNWDIQKAKEMKVQGHSVRYIASLLKISKSSVARELACSNIN